MKGTFFSKPLEWNIETVGESWHQGDCLQGTLKVKNHGTEGVDLSDCGVGIAYAEMKKVQSRAEGALSIEHQVSFSQSRVLPGEEASVDFSFEFSPNGPVTDKKCSHYLCYGKDFKEGQLQLKIIPKELYLQIIRLFDTFYRFKQKEFKTTKKGVEYKLLPPSSRDMANIESLLLTFSMQEDSLCLKFDFQVKKLDTSFITTKINKEKLCLEKSLLPKEYSLGRGMLNQDNLLKAIEEVLSSVKMKALY